MKFIFETFFNRINSKSIERHIVIFLVHYLDPIGYFDINFRIYLMNTKNDLKITLWITQDQMPKTNKLYISQSAWSITLKTNFSISHFKIGISSVKYNQIDFDQETLFNMKKDPFEIKNLMEEPTKFHLKLA